MQGEQMENEQNLDLNQTAGDAVGAASQSTDQSSQVNNGLVVEGEDKFVKIPVEKWREVNEKITSIKRTPVAQPEVQQNTSNNQVASQGEEMLARLAGTLKEQIATMPELSFLRSMQEDKAIDEVSQMPYANELATEIAEHMNSNSMIPGHLPYRDRLLTAYQLALGANVHKIVESSSKKGYDDAYKTIATKTGNTVTQQRAAPTGRFASNDIPTDVSEYNKQRAELFAKNGLGKPYG
jgi:hypothetical protein